MLNKFEGFINESAYTKIGNMKFIIKPKFSGNFIGVEFIPDWKTLEDYSKGDILKEIKRTISKSKSELSDALMYVPNSISDSFLFEVNIYPFIDKMIQELR